MTALRVMSLVVLLAASMVGRAQAAAPTEVRLKPTAELRHDLATIGDVADVSGPTASLATRIKAFDLAVLDGPGDRETITPKHVQARLLLEGIDRRSVVITGSPETVVTLAPRSTTNTETRTVDYQADVLAQASEALSRAWLSPQEDIEVQILACQSGLIAASGSTAVPELQLPNRLEPGRIQGTLKWTSQGKVERVEQITLEARLRQTVVLAAHKIERGVPLRPQDIVEDRRMLTSRVEQVRADQIVGAVARRGLNQGDVVTPKDLAVMRQGPAVQPRAGVRVVAKKGKLNVVLQMAEAMDAGNVGDVIRVRNLQSGRIINAKVLSNQEVEVPLN
jgi:flagellar basal body P-ring formation protein FlgA